VAISTKSLWQIHKNRMKGTEGKVPGPPRVEDTHFSWVTDTRPEPVDLLSLTTSVSFSNWRLSF